MRRIATIAQVVPGVIVWDPLPLLCPDDACGSADARKPMLFDGDHISGYANNVLAKDFIQEFRPLR
jgi:hypothetical protein